MVSCFFFCLRLRVEHIAGCAGEKKIKTLFQQLFPHCDTKCWGINATTCRECLFSSVIVSLLVCSQAVVSEHPVKTHWKVEKCAVWMYSVNKAIYILCLTCGEYFLLDAFSFLTISATQVIKAQSQCQLYHFRLPLNWIKKRACKSDIFHAYFRCPWVWQPISLFWGGEACII